MYNLNRNIITIRRKFVFAATIFQPSNLSAYHPHGKYAHSPINKSKEFRKTKEFFDKFQTVHVVRVNIHGSAVRRCCSRATGKLD